MKPSSSHTTTDTNEHDTAVDRDRAHKIQSLREMISNAEQTIQSAKAMLLQIEGKKKLGRKRKIEDIEDGSVVEGAFDGQIMIGNDGKRYPVPANYASKSKLVQGDILKLTITTDGSFIYKQIGPANRKNAIGIISQDESGNYFIVADGKAYRVLLASITYFKAEPGDEVALVLPRDMEASWCAIENILQKASGMNWHNGHQTPAPPQPKPTPRPTVDMEHWKKDLDAPTPEKPITKETESKSDDFEDTPLAMPSEESEKSTPSTVAPIQKDADATPDEAEAERLRQEIIDEWLKDTSPASAATE